MDDDVVVATGLIWRDVGRSLPTDGSIAEALRLGLDSSSCWRPTDISTSMRGHEAIGTPLPYWERPGTITEAEASVVAAALVEAMPSSVQFVRMQVETMSDATELRRIGTIGGSVVVTSYPSRGSLSIGLTWRWPLRVGVLSIGRAQGWLADVRDSAHHGVVYDAEVLAPGERYEIAIVDRDDLDELAPDVIEQLRSTPCVIAIGPDAAIDLMDAVEDRIGSVIAVGIGAPPAAWWRDFFEAMSHDLPIDVAVAEIRLRSSVDAEIAGPARGMDVTAAAHWFAAVAPDHPEMAAALDEFISWDWSSEGGGGWNTRHLVDEARAGGADPQAVVPLQSSWWRGGVVLGNPNFHVPRSVPRSEETQWAEPVAATATAAVDTDPAGDDVSATVEADSGPRPGRFVHAVVVADKVERKSLIAGRMNVLRTWIGPDRGEFASRTSDATPEVGRDVTLHVDLLVGRAVVASGSMFLPGGEGACSSECELTVPPLAAGIFAGELAFTLDGRMYELVSVSGVVLAAGTSDSGMPELQLDSLVERRDLSLFGTRSSSAAVLDIKQEGGEIVVREFGNRSSGVYDLTTSLPLVRKLTSALYATEVSLVRKQQQSRPAGFAGVGVDVGVDTDPAWTDVVRTMAKHGWLLHRRLREQGFAVPGERLEIINRLPDGYVPIEFVYDRGNPTADSEMDPECLEALRRGDDDCGRCNAFAALTDQERNLNPRICPFGFWSLGKVIERHDADEQGRLSARSSTTDKVHRLHRVDSVLAGWSTRLRTEDGKSLPEQLRIRGHHVATVDSWDRWVEELDNQPSILLALPHHAEVDGIGTLEIGQSTLELGQALDLYVKTPAGEPGPILILLGCETSAEGDLGHPSFAREFSRHASVVIGTLSKVLGRHAVPFAHRLIETLVDAQDKGGDIGTVMRDVRRRMFADGYLMALGVIALGDADWQLTGNDVA